MSKVEKAIAVTKLLTNFAACESLFLLASWWIGVQMNFRPQADLQIGILVSAAYFLPWLFLGGYAAWLLLQRAMQWHLHRLSWFAPGLVLAALAVTYKSSLLYL